MARFKIGALKINGGAIAPVNNGALMKFLLRTLESVKHLMLTKESVKQEVRTL